MKTTLLTAIYFGLDGFPFYTWPHLARYERYLYSLLQISKMGLPIICYTNKREDIEKLLLEHNVTNIQIIEKDLSEFDYSKKLLEVKKVNPIEFYHEIDYAKLEILKTHYKESDYIYWIDAGLCYWSLWPNKYNLNKIDGISSNIQNYEFSKVFNNEFIPNINNFVNDKLLQIRNTKLWYNGTDTNKATNRNHVYKWFAIGGIIGGNVKYLPTLFENFDTLIDIAFSKNDIVNHEAVMTIIGLENKNIFESFVFDTWYHEDSLDGLGEVIVEPEEFVSFSNFVEYIK